MSTSPPPTAAPAVAAPAAAPAALNQPNPVRAHAFFDGQNLYYAARREFGVQEADYDPKKLAQAVCDQKGWQLDKVHFYTGVPDSRRFQRLAAFWSSKIKYMKLAGVEVHTRPVVYRWEDSPLYGDSVIVLPDNTEVTIRDPLYFQNGNEIPQNSTLLVYVGREKGIDISIGVDVIRLALARVFDVAIVFSQDNDLSPVADEIRIIAGEQKRWLKIASAYPYGGKTKFKRGIDKTDWVPIDQATYEACKDPNNNWPAR